MTPARTIPLFAVAATHRYGRTYEVTIGRDTYAAHDEGGRWTVAIHDSASYECLALGHGTSVTDAERECLRDLDRSVRRRVETRQEIEGRREAA